MVGRTPEVTVVMPVYNALPYFDQATASILAQTMPDFRLAIYDDHSDDGSYERALDWARRDPRISVTRGARRLGPVGSSNAAALLATSEFIARMDADDIAMPERLAIQLEVLKAHPQAVLIGSIFEMIDGSGTVIRAATRGQSNWPNPPIAHTSILYRRAAFLTAGGYRQDTDYFEDQDLYRRMAQVGQLVVVDVPLIQLRFAGQHARLCDSRMDVLEQINRQYLPGIVHDTIPAQWIDPVAFYSVGVLAVLGLQPPHLFWTMIRRASFDRPLTALAVLTFVGLADISPRMARGLNEWFGKLRSGGFAKSAARPSIRIWTFDSR
jgi:glycosyltransferase involved in cell wall biosynthesis